jgi:nucleoside-diphosphate-sugar epimerase
MGKTLVTGSHGTIGSELKPFLEEIGYEIATVLNKRHGNNRAKS